MLVYKLCYRKYFNQQHISLAVPVVISMLIKNLAQNRIRTKSEAIFMENDVYLMLGSVRLDIKLLQIVVIVLVIVLASRPNLFKNSTKMGYCV